MTIYDFQHQYNKHNPTGHWFDKDTLKFFGERLSDMRVLNGFTYIDGVKCYVVSHLQRKHPGGPRRRYTYFDAETFRDVTMNDETK